MGMTFAVLEQFETFDKMTFLDSDHGGMDLECHLTKGIKIIAYKKVWS